MFQTASNHWLQQFDWSGMTSFMKFISFFGEVYPVMLICLIIVGVVHQQKGWLLLNIVAFSAFLTVWAKEYIDFPRPIAVDTTLESFGGEKATTPLQHMEPNGFWEVFSDDLLAITRASEVGRYGFPSGHTSGQFALWIGMALLFRKRWLTIFAVVFVLLTMISRLYLGVHYLGDVLGGLLLGALVTFIIYKLGSYALKSETTFIYAFSGLILLPLATLTTSGSWQACLLLGINAAFLIMGSLSNYELASTIKHRLLNVFTLFLLFFASFYTVKVMVRDLAEVWQGISMCIVGFVVFYVQLSIAKKCNWIVNYV